jgi:hypothetical protein
MPQFQPILAGMHPILALLLVGAIFAVVLAAAYFLFMVPAIKRRAAEEAEKADRIESRGKPVLAWIVMAHNDLYEQRDTDEYRMAQVIYTFHQLPSPEKTLGEIARKLPAYRAGPDATEEERRVSLVMETEIPDVDPARVPESIAGELPVYAVSLRVPWRKLPDRKLTKPYVWCKVLEGESDNVRMTAYPGGR